MAGRGGWGFRGRGRGAYVRPVPFVLYPEDINLPDVKHKEIDASKRQLIKWDFDFDNHFKVAPYFLEEKAEMKGRKKKMHVQRFSDKKKTTFIRDSLPQVLVYDEFIKELVPGKKMLGLKKRTWNPEDGQKKLARLEADILKEIKTKKEEKDEESEAEEEEEIEEASESEGEDDYEKNICFDDDEDDFNPDDTGADEDEL